MSQTDEAGWYHLGGLLQKEIVQLTVHAEGFAPRILRDIDMPDGFQSRRLDLILAPVVRLSGSVTGPYGMPVWLSDVGDDTHRAAAQRARGNINIENSLESLSPG